MINQSLQSRRGGLGECQRLWLVTTAEGMQTPVEAVPIVLPDMNRNHSYSQKAVLAVADFGIRIQLFESAAGTSLVIAIHFQL